MWPTWTRSKAPWQSTMRRSRNCVRMRARSASGTTFWVQPSLAGASGRTGLSGAAPRPSLMTAPFEGGQSGQRAPYVDEILDAERLALALLPCNQVHWHCDIRRRETQRLDQDFGLKPVAVRLDAQALEYRRAVDLQTVVIGEPPPRNAIHQEREQLRDERPRPRPRL